MLKVSLEEALSEVSSLKERENYAKALELVEKIIGVNPKLLSGYRHKADILSLQKKRTESLEITKKLADLNSSEPSDYYDLARRCLPLGLNSDVLKWSKKGIELCKAHENLYYIESLYFYRACSLLNMKRYTEAIDSCKNIKDGFSVYLYGFGKKCKEDILKACEIEIKKQAPKIIRFD